MKGYLHGFIGGFIGTLLFHQMLQLVLNHYVTGVPPPFNLEAVPPLGVPKVISLSFWGGVWGAALWPLLGNRRGLRHWLGWIVAGALGPSLVALLIVFPLKGLPFAAGGVVKTWIGAFMLNGVWGLGVAIYLKAVGAQRS